MNEMIILWLIVLILAIVIEVISLGLTSIWFAGGAILALIAALFNANLGIQIALFVLSSVLLLYFTRPIAVKYFNKDRIKTNAESLIGRQAIVISEISNLQGIGQVTVGGQEWTARSEDDHKEIPVGAVVEVVAIDGVKAIVKELPQSVTQTTVQTPVDNNLE
jgi:membrane protein implicated in regulation of membrane protease activity